MPTLTPDRAKAIDRHRSAHTPASMWTGQARVALIRGGVPESLVFEVEQGTDPDWLGLAGEIDGLSMALGGRLGVRLFWETPSRHLAGQVPLQALQREGGVERLSEAVRMHRLEIERAKVS